MGNCKDCRSWIQHRDLYGFTWATCSAIVASTIRPGDYDATLIVSDDTYPGQLWTGPLFGCVQFQLRTVINP